MKKTTFKIQSKIDDDYIIFSLLFDGINPAENAEYSPIVDPEILLSSYNQGISDYLYTCGCGNEGCAGVYSETGIIHDEAGVLFVLATPISFSTVDDLPTNRTFNYFYVENSNFNSELSLFAKMIIDHPENKIEQFIGHNNSDQNKIIALSKIITR